MVESSFVSPVRDPRRENANVDFCDSSVGPTPRWPDSIADDADHRLEDDLYHAFRTAGYAQLRHIRITQQDGRVVLHGRVPTYFLKQFAQSLVLSRPSVQVVDNDIEVVCSH